MVVRLRGAHEVHGTFHAHAPDFLQHPADRIHRLDVRDGGALRALLDRLRPEAVVHCAAFTNVDACESAPEEARRANVAPVEEIVRWARPHGARVVQMSTDYVFDGEHPPYEVDAEASPLCVYSKSKADAEAAARAFGGSLIVRSTVIYGADFGHLKRNFATWLIGELEAKRGVRVVDDQWGTPTISENIAEFVERALERRLTGTIHAAVGECVSRLEFARRIASHFGLDASLIAAAKTAELHQPARRPRRPCLAMARSEEALGVKAWTMAKSLELLARQLAMDDRTVLRPWW
jgi:dTDP-4-dehydrorhamnose reductase